MFNSRFIILIIKKIIRISEIINTNLFMGFKFSGYFLLVLIVLACGCQFHSQQPLAKAWFFTLPETDEERKAVLEYGTTLDVRRDDGNFIDLQADSSFTCAFPLFDYGRWQVYDNKLVLYGHQYRLRKLEIKKLTDGELICTDVFSKLLYHFNGFQNSFSSASENPFSPQNNQWRLKADHKSSDQEISNRIRNHFRYWEKYFAWGKKTDIRSLDYTNTPSPLKMYGNGFGVQYPDDQLPEWRNVFYDTADCRKAYEQVYYLLVRHNVQWLKTKDRNDRFVSAFQQLQSWQ